MDIELVKKIFLDNFSFLYEIGFTTINVYQDKSYKYKIGISLENNVLGYKFNFAYYDKNPIDNNTETYGLFFALFSKDSHIDISRLLKGDNFFGIYSIFQYFILPHEVKYEYVLKSLSKIIKDNYLEIFKGEYWIAIDYDLRDDY